MRVSSDGTASGLPKSSRVTVASVVKYRTFSVAVFFFFDPICFVEAENSSRSDEEESSDEEDNSSLFGGPLSLHGLGNPILKGASENPGNLYRQAALAASSQTGDEGGDWESWAPADEEWEERELSRGVGDNHFS